MNALILAMAAVFSHPGGLDANGGHHDRKHGGYHYHRAPASAASSTQIDVSEPIDLPEARQSPRLTARTEARTRSRMSVDTAGMVYVAKGKTEYHLAGCEKLPFGAKPTTLEAASKNHVPCKICEPPIVPGAEPDPAALESRAGKSDEEKAAALLSMGRAMLRKAKPAQAAKLFGRVVSEYPDTNAAKAAREHLRASP